MKTWNDLTYAQRTAVLERELFSFTEALTEIGPHFFDNDPELTKAFMKAYDDMERNQTPWFLGERILEDKALWSWLEAQARSYAEGALYQEPHEDVIRLPILPE